MTTKDPNDLSARLGALSPEKQALLARKLAGRSANRGDSGGERITPRIDRGPAPLSSAQELLWLFEQMTPGTAAYNVPVLRRVRGVLNLDALQRAFDAVVQRHESLRTKFIEVDGSPRQEVLAPASLPIEHHDLSGVASELREGQAEKILREAAARPLDLAAGTHPRVVLITLAPNESLLLLVVHHIIFDGVSGGVLWREIAAVYEATLSGTSVVLPPLPIQFADFATWEREQLSSGRMEPALAFWREELAGTASGLDVPTDFPGPSGGAGPGARYTTVLSSAIRDNARSLASAHGATLFMTLMAAFQTVLHRYSGQSDVVVGTAVAGRDRAETAGLVGYVSNSIALRARFEGDPSFAELLTQVRQRTVKAFEHQHVPYDELARELRAGLPAAEQALFRVVFTVQDTSGAVLKLGDATLEPVGVGIGAPKFDINISVAEVAHGIELVVDYRSDLFRDDTIERLLGHFGQVLTSAARNAQLPVSQLPLMEAAERELVVNTWNNTAAEYPSGQGVHELISAQAARTPDAIAVIDQWERLSYAELEARANGLAARLQLLGVRPGAMVGIMAERSAATVTGILAILKAGAAYVPLDPSHPAERLAFIARDTAFRILVGRTPAQQVLGDSTDVMLVSPDATAPVDAAGVHVPTSGDDIAYVIYTSGSTGTPKGVLVTHDNLMVSTWARVLRYPEPVGRYLLLSCFAFDSSVAGLFWTLIQGGALVVPGEGTHLDAGALCTLLREERVTHLLGVPSFLQAVFSAATAEDLETLRVTMTGGDWCSRELIELHRELAPRAGFYTEYGPTETTVWCSVLGIEPGAPIPRVTIGNPMPNYRMYILDSRGEPMPIGLAGEIFIGGLGVSKGYLKRPELNRDLFVRDPFNPLPDSRMYRTGERGRWLPNGEIEFLGRIDFQVKVRGYRVELKEIELTLDKHPLVAQAAVVLRAERGGEIVAYVVPEEKAGSAVSSATRAGQRDELRLHMARNLPEYMLPSAIVFVDAMPVTSSGKFDRNALPAPDFDAPTEDLPPDGPVEEVVASVWCQALQIERVGRTVSFFELGGHSLLVTRVVAALGKLFRIQLPVRAMFDAPSVAGVAAALVARETVNGRTAQVAQVVLKLQAQTAPVPQSNSTDIQSGMHA